MPEPTDDLLTWLRAQLDDDEQSIRTWGSACVHIDACHDTGDFMERFGEDRLLAEVDAKRRILDRCAQAYREQGIYGEDGQEQVAEDLLRLLALPFADRPGYRAT